MLTLECDLVSAGPILFSRKISSERNTGESHEAFEKRTWRERMHVNAEGYVFIPACALKRTLENVAQYLSESVPGKGKATYTKHFKAGIMVIQDIELQPQTKDKDVKGVWMNVPSDGKRGGSKRVDRCFPVITEWRGHAEIILVDPILIDAPGKVEEYLGHAGKFVGLMSMSPRNGGSYGRFSIKNIRTKKTV
jgi:hypothetical protein